MEKSEKIAALQKLLEETLEKMTFTDFTIDVREENEVDGENIVFNIGSKESDLMIGQYGANLRALQHLLRAMARRRVEDKLRFSIDVNNYSREKVGSLEDLARNMARQAIDEQRAVVLRPMSAYERRIVHLILSENDQVKTESVGEGEERKVVIKPAGELEGSSAGDSSLVS